MKLFFISSMVVAVCLCCPGCQTSLPGDIAQLTGLQKSDEEKIMLVLDDVQRGMENRRLYHVLAHVSRAYKDRSGRDYATLSRDLNTLLQHYRNIRIKRATSQIQVQGNRARVVDAFGASAEAVDPQEDAPLNLQGQVVILLERNGDVWQIIEWGPIT